MGYEYDEQKVDDRKHARIVVIGLTLALMLFIALFRIAPSISGYFEEPGTWSAPNWKLDVISSGLKGYNVSIVSNRYLTLWRSEMAMVLLWLNETILQQAGLPTTVDVHTRILLDFDVSAPPPTEIPLRSWYHSTTETYLMYAYLVNYYTLVTVSVALNITMYCQRYTPSYETDIEYLCQYIPYIRSYLYNGTWYAYEYPLYAGALAIDYDWSPTTRYAKYRPSFRINITATLHGNRALLVFNIVSLYYYNPWFMETSTGADYRWDLYMYNQTLAFEIPYGKTVNKIQHFYLGGLNSVRSRMPNGTVIYNYGFPTDTWFMYFRIAYTQPPTTPTPTPIPTPTPTPIIPPETPETTITPTPTTPTTDVERYDITVSTAMIMLMVVALLLTTREVKRSVLK